MTEPEREPEAESSERLSAGTLAQVLMSHPDAHNGFARLQEHIGRFAQGMKEINEGFASDKGISVLEASAKAATAGLDEEDE